MHDDGGLLSSLHLQVTDEESDAEHAHSLCE